LFVYVAAHLPQPLLKIAHSLTDHFNILNSQRKHHFQKLFRTLMAVSRPVFPYVGRERENYCGMIAAVRYSRLQLLNLDRVLRRSADTPQIITKHRRWLYNKKRSCSYEGRSYCMYV